MAGEAPAICAACGTPLGPQEEEIDHPKDDNNPDNPHFTVQIRDSDDAERLQCNKTGQIAAVATPGEQEVGNTGKSYAEIFQEFHDELPPGVGEPAGGGESEPTQSGRPEPEPGGIYDIQEEKTQIDLLQEVVTNPRYGLNDEHIQEVRGWAQDMDGRLPPATLEDILKNLKGVQKQTASLIRQRYELKLNKWMRNQSTNDGGPQIGIGAPGAPGQSSSSFSGSRPTPTPSGGGKTGNQSPTKEELERGGRPSRGGPEPSPDNLREYRRTRRTQRRQEFADTATQKIAEEAADEIARQLIPEMGRYLGLPAKIVEAKIEKDPDWALELADRLDIDIMDLMEPSEQRKKEMREENNRSSPQVDSEVDDALERMRSGGQEESSQPHETPKSPPPQQQNASPMTGSPDEAPPTVEEEFEGEQQEKERAGEELFE